MQTKVKFSNVFKVFDLHAKRSEKILNLFLMRKKKKNNEKFLALRDVSFEVYEGETIGIIGLNGSGKSTASNILSGVIQASKGDVEVNGETSLIAIAAGLNPSLTGIDNIELKCMMHGLSKSRIKEITPDIIEFADIGKYIHQPVKDYSSGMKSRLGFAISVHTDPDILVIDEALSVGDSTFAQKSLNKIESFKKQGKTIFFISHSASQMKEFCDRIIWLHYGQVKEIGEADEVVHSYVKFVNWFNRLPDEEKKQYKDEMLEEQIQVVDEREIVENLDSNRLLNGLQNAAVIIPVILFGIFLLAGY